MYTFSHTASLQFSLNEITAVSNDYVETMTDVITYEVSERIATLTLNRPGARNALNTEVLRLLPQLMQQADADDNVDVIILTGSDPVFCAGVDLKVLGDTADNVRG
jgi:enoyl-CoA hydratase